MYKRTWLPVEPALCSGCSACAAACPTHAISMREDEEGFPAPVLEPGLCVSCGQCDSVCPMLHPTKNEAPECVWAAWGRDDDLRRRSSSGGVGALLARAVVRRGGAVVGAVMEDFHVHHKVVETMDGLAALQGSKYVQSDMGDCFPRVLELLDAGREVLFTGTPCQVAGLRNLAGRNRDNLVCADLICHGVPSPGVLRSYVEELRESWPDATSLTFRDKVDGWNGHYTIALQGAENTVLFRDTGGVRTFF